MNKIYFNKKKLSVKIKCRLFNTYVASIFLYNSEIWTLTESLEKQIDAFHRKLLRTAVLNIRWPKIMKSEDVYRITKETNWSEIIKRRRLSWIGHLFRLPDDTPAKTAFKVCQRKINRTRGRPKLDWITMIRKQLNDTLNLTLEDAIQTAQNRKEWRRIVMQTTCGIRE